MASKIASLSASSSSTLGRVLVTNSQSAIRIHTRVLQRQIETMMATNASLRQFDVHCWLAGDRRLQSLNNYHRGINKPTDILSFAVHDQLKPGELPRVDDTGIRDLGEMIISVPYVHRVAVSRGVPYHHHLAFVVSHGLCHLLGHDHDTPTKQAAMQRQEKIFMKAIGVPYIPW